MGSPDAPKTADPIQPDAPAAKLVSPLEDSPANAVKKKTALRQYLTAPASSTPSGVGVQL